MQKAIFKKITSAVIRTVMYIILFWILFKMGIHPIWAVIILLAIKGIFRFTGCLLNLLPVSLVIAILFIYLLTCI